MKNKHFKNLTSAIPKYIDEIWKTDCVCVIFFHVNLNIFLVIVLATVPYFLWKLDRRGGMDIFFNCGKTHFPIFMLEKV